MSRQVLNLAQASQRIHLEPNELKHAVQRGELEAAEHGGDLFIELMALDEWAQRNLLASTPRELKARHRVMVTDQQREHEPTWSVTAYFHPEMIELSLGAKAKAGILRDMTDLADRGGLVYDVDGLFKELQAREESASTAIGHGVALLHPRFSEEYMFQEAFIAYGRSVRPVFFGDADGEGTRHFFLICSTDRARHLHVLARLALLARETDLMERLDGAETAEQVITTLATCESELKA